MRCQFPMPILGIDSDNDGVFINEAVIAYCQQQKLEFTRSRAYQRNDQAWIEQKNGPVVRRFVGYKCFSGMVAGQCSTGHLVPERSKVVRPKVSNQPGFAEMSDEQIARLLVLEPCTRTQFPAIHEGLRVIQKGMARILDRQALRVRTGLPPRVQGILLLQIPLEGAVGIFPRSKVR